MPLLLLECAEGHRYEALKSFSTHDPDLDRCPTCGSTEMKSLPATKVNTKAPIDVSKMDKDEYDLHMENRLWQEANAEKLLSGEMGHVVPSSCPEEFRPRVPEHLKKRYY